MADAAPDGVTAGIGVNVYLRRGEFPLLVEGDRAAARKMELNRGEMELVLADPEGVWAGQRAPAASSAALGPYRSVESVEGRLVSFSGQISWAGRVTACWWSTRRIPLGRAPAGDGTQQPGVGSGPLFSQRRSLAGYGCGQPICPAFALERRV